MKHPSNEQWMEFLYEELPAESKAELSNHLENCPLCSNNLDVWRGTMRQLDGWSLPMLRTAKPFVSSGSIWRWGAAAVIALSVAFGVGRLSSAQPNLDRIQAGLAQPLRQIIERDLRKQFQEKLDAQLALAIEANRVRMLNEMNARMDEVSQRTLAQAVISSQKQVEELGTAFAGFRDEDKKAILAAFQKFEDERLNDLLSQRKDLETVAVHTEQNFATAQRQLIQLAGFTQPTQKPK